MERERRFLLRGVPEGVPDRIANIVDRYLVGTRLRLRSVRWDDDREEWKLARKLPHGPGGVVMGNLYLSAHEYALVATLPAHELRKRRLVFGSWLIDVFANPHGLVLAEIEDDDPSSLANLVPPFPYEREVTGVANFEGATLASKT
ncbi:MAG: hypothetical protein AAGE52_29580 [Myxococcota bacterium]